MDHIYDICIALSWTHKLKLTWNVNLLNVNHPQVIQDIDEFVFSNGCRQNESPKQLIKTSKYLIHTTPVHQLMLCEELRVCNKQIHL